MIAIQVGNGVELDTVGRQFETYRWRPRGVTWDLFPNSLMKLRRTSAFFSWGQGLKTFTIKVLNLRVAARAYRSLRHTRDRT